MGKIIRAQRIGKSPRRRARSHRFKGESSLPDFKEPGLSGKIVDIIHDPGRTAPLAEVKYSNNKVVQFAAPLNLKTGEIVYAGKEEIKSGNVLELGKIPEGTLVCNSESIPGDGGKFARAAGTFIRVITHDVKGTIVQLPSGVFKTLNNKCRAVIGIVAGGGRQEKPLVKAGRLFHALRAKGRVYPRVKGVNMNPVDHPFGGGAHPHIGKPKTVSRNAPPGRKIGSIAARRTGMKR